MSGVYRRCRLVTLPPPNFPPPFPKAVEAETEPGLGLLQVKAERDRYRRERNEARAERDELLANSPSIPPPTRRQKAVGGVVGTVQWVGVATLLLTAAVQIASAYRPGLVGPLQQLLQLLGGQ